MRYPCARSAFTCFHTAARDRPSLSLMTSHETNSSPASARKASTSSSLPGRTASTMLRIVGGRGRRVNADGRARRAPRAGLRGPDLERDVHRPRAVCERAHRDEVDARRRHQRQPLQGHVPARLEERAPGRAAHRLGHVGGLHVFEQHDVGARRERLVEPGEVHHLDLDLEEGARSGAGPAHRLADAAARRDVVVLDEDAVAEREAVVRPAAGAHGVLLQPPPAGRRLARVEEPRPAAPRGERVGAAARQRRDTREPLQEVEGGALGREERGQPAPRRADPLAARRARALGAVEAAGGAEALEDARGDGGPGEDEIVLGQESPLPLRGGVERGLARRVAEEEVLLEREIEEPLDVGRERGHVAHLRGRRFGAGFLAKGFFFAAFFGAVFLAPFALFGAAFLATFGLRFAATFFPCVLPFAATFFPCVLPFTEPFFPCVLPLAEPFFFAPTFASCVVVEDPVPLAPRSGERGTGLGVAVALAVAAELGVAAASASTSQCATSRFRFSRSSSARARSFSTTSFGARSTKLGFPSFFSMPARSPSTFASSFSMRAPSAAMSTTPASGTRTSNPLPTATALPVTLCVAALVAARPSTLARRRMRCVSSRTVASASAESAPTCTSLSGILNEMFISPRRLRRASTT